MSQMPTNMNPSDLYQGVPGSERLDRGLDFLHPQTNPLSLQPGQTPLADDWKRQLAASRIPPSGALDQAWKAYLSDYQQTKYGANENYDAVNQQLGQLNSTIGSNANKMTTALEGSRGALARGAGAIDELGNHQQGVFDDAWNSVNSKIAGREGDFSKSGAGVQNTADSYAKQLTGAAGKMTGAVDHDVSEGYSLADKAVSDFKNEVNAYGKQAESDAISQADSMAHNTRSQLQYLDAQTPIDPQTGQVLSPAEVSDRKFQLYNQNGEQINSIVTNYMADARKSVMSLKQIGANLAMGAAGMRFQGAALKKDAASQSAGIIEAAGKLSTEAGLAIRGQDLEAAKTFGAQEQGQISSLQSQNALRAQMSQWTVQANQFMESFYNTSLANVAQFEVQGRQTMAQWTQANRRSVVSLFNGITAMMALASAPGSGGMPAMGLPGQSVSLT